MNRSTVQFIHLLGAMAGIPGLLSASGDLSPGEKNLFTIELTRQEVSWIKSSGLSGYTLAEIAIAVPEAFDPGKTYPILVTCVTGDRYLNNIQEMDKYWPQAIENGWVVVTGWADPHPYPDTKAYRRAVTAAAMRKLAELIPESRNWPVAAGGFSGGGKNAAVIAAYLQRENYRIIGLFMGGCNQDMASYAMKRISPNKETFRKIPIFISNGESDRIADTTKTKALLKALRRSGFSNVRLETYPGRHSLNQDHVPVALDWFLEVSRP